MKKLLLLTFLLFSAFYTQAQTGFTCATARVIPSLPYQDNYTTCGSGNDISTATCDNTYSSGEDVIYKVTINNAPITLNFALSNVASGNYSSILVSTSCTFNPCIADLTSSTGNLSGNVNITTNGTYYIKIDAWTPPACYSYTLSITPPPANDLICNAIKLTVNGACINSNNSLATSTAASDISSCITESNTVWYYFDATDDSMTVTSVYDHLYGEMALFSSSNNLCTGTLTQAACTSTTAGPNKLEFKMTNLIVGNRYFVMIDGWSTYTGNSCVSVIETPDAPPIYGSSCMNPRVLYPKTGCGPDPTSQANPNDNMGNVLNATFLNGTLNSCDFSESFLDVSGTAFNNATVDGSCADNDLTQKASWVKFTATGTTTTFKNNTTTNGASMDYAVFSGPCATLVPINCNTVAKGGSVSFPTTIGTVYYVMITAGGANSKPNQHWLCVTSTANTGVNPIDNCANAYNVSDGIPAYANNAMATQDGNQYMCAGTTSVPNNNVWFKWTTPASWPAGDAAFVHVYNQDCNTTAGVQIDVYDKTVNCGNVATGTPPCVAFTAPGTTESFYASWIPSIGGTYYISIDGNCGTVCSFDLQINNTATVTVPVELLNFKLNNSKSGNEVIWTTASEVNNDYFALDKSIDGINFEQVGKIKGSGTSISQKNYHYSDNNIHTGYTYYRLRQVDFNGKFSYSKVISSLYKGDGIKIEGVYPNPASDHLNYEVFVPSKNEKLTLEVIDVLGKTILREIQNSEEGTNHLTEDLSSLPKGMYFLRVESNYKSDIRRFVKE